MRSDRTAMTAALEGRASNSEAAPMALRTHSHEGRGPPIEGGLRPEPQTRGHPRTPVQSDGYT
jgi:hypothetical protein